MMAESDETDPLKRWIRIMNKGHGYAGVFNYYDHGDKLTVEKSTIEEWRVSMKAEFGIEMEVPQPNPDDPPDFFVSVAGKRLNVELVQLVDQAHKKRAVKGESPFAGQLFLDTQWSSERLISKLSQTIQKKGDKYKERGLDIDVLVIHTAEPWLTATDAQTWLGVGDLDRHPSILAVFLLFDYEPGRGVRHWPVISVYGEMPQFSNDD